MQCDVVYLSAEYRWCSLIKFIYNIDKSLCFKTKYSLVISWFICILSCFGLAKDLEGEQAHRTSFSTLGKMKYAQ